MIRPEELRVNNYVEYNGIYCKIASIISPEPRKDERFSDKWLIDLYDAGGTILSIIDEIKPIPLDEEWLKKLGFTYLKRINKYYNGIFYIGISPEGDFCFEIGRTTPYIKIIDYAHELQNLYFALT